MTNASNSGRLDLSPFARFTVGFDEIFNDLHRIGGYSQQEAGYPPYNIIKNSEDQYTVEIAVAGFSESEIDVNVENNHLTVTGTRAERTAEVNYVHKGISGRNFSKVFTLGNYIEVNSAAITNGMLTIELKRIVPEALKPRKIAITATQ